MGSITINGVGGNFQPQGPQGPNSGQTDYSKMSDAELQKKLNDPNTSPEEKQKVLEEMVKRAEKKAAEDAANGDAGAADDQKKLQEILKKLQNGEKLSEEDKQFLQKMGIDLGDSNNV
jgi:uncharacterized coiled-coil DUF342 family protein